MNQEELNYGEKSMLSLYNFTLSVFVERFGKDAIIGVNLTPLANECWITILVNQRTQEMIDVAQELEREFSEDWGRHICLFVKQPWKATLRNLTTRVLSWRAIGK
jgi:hypothetical protein